MEVHIPGDDHAIERHLVTGVAVKRPVSGSDRQKTYRRGRSGKSVDMAGATHALLAQLCRLEGASIDATLRSVLARALEERNDSKLPERVNDNETAGLIV